MVVLVGTEKTKFGFGVQERAKRNLYKLRSGSSRDFVNVTSSDASVVDVVSVFLNPTAVDSLSPTVQLQLSLGYGPILREQRLFANYLWFSEYPAVKLLTRPKNPISREGEKPPGESSVIGAFSSRMQP